MDVQKKLDEIVTTVGSARSMPMSASCVVNRAELLALLEEVREALPGSLAQARELIGGQEEVVARAREEAGRIISAAHQERGSLIADTEVARRSQDEAERILTEAREEAVEIRAEADDYVDSKLANFEVVLTKTLGSVGRGRDKLLGAAPGDHQDPDYAEAPERSHDPETLRRRADEYVDVKLRAFEAVLAKTLDAVGRGRQKLHGRVVEDELGSLGEERTPRAPPVTPTTSRTSPRSPSRPPRHPPGAAARPRRGPRPRLRPSRRPPSRPRRPRPRTRSRSSTATRSSRTRTDTSRSTASSSTRTATRTRTPTATRSSSPYRRRTRGRPRRTAATRCPASRPPRSPRHWTRPASSTRP